MSPAATSVGAGASSESAAASAAIKQRRAAARAGARRSGSRSARRPCAGCRRRRRARARSRPSGSRRIRPTSTSSPPAAPPGVGNCSSRIAGRVGEDRRRLLGRERLLRLDPDRLGVPDEHRHPHARRADRERRQLEDLARLLAQLLLLVELDAVEVPVHAQVVLLRRLAAQPLHRLRAGAGDRLVGGDAHAHEPGGVVQRLEGAGERDRAAVRVGDDALVLGRPDRRSPRGRRAGLPARAGRRTTCRRRPRRRGRRGGRARARPRCRPRRGRGRGRRRRAPRASPPRRSIPPSSLPAERAEANRRTSP